MSGLVDSFLKYRLTKKFEEWNDSVEEVMKLEKDLGTLKRKQVEAEKRKIFFNMWKDTDSDTKYSFLKQHLIAKSPSIGYQILIELAQRDYFNLILSTNLDLLLENTLKENELISGQDYIICSNSRETPEVIEQQIRNKTAPLLIIKLHGTIEFADSYAFTAKEIFSFKEKIQPILSDLLNESLIMIGYSGHDRDVDILFTQKGKEIHFIGLDALAEDSRLTSIIEVRGKGTQIIGEEGNFDTFFMLLKNK